MKVHEKSDGQIHYPVGAYIVAGFIDESLDLVVVLLRKVSMQNGTILLFNKHF